MTAINPKHYDGQRHTVTCATGIEYIEAWKAYRADGFFCQTPRLVDGRAHFEVCKPMAGESW